MIIRLISRLYYKISREYKALPFGATRQLANQPTSELTDYGYTGQRNLDDDPSTGSGQRIGLMDYKARFYSPVLNRFIQPDSIVPDPTNSQAWNRFSYVYNNPINYTDPTGHKVCDADGYCGYDTINNRNQKGGNRNRENNDGDDIIDEIDTLEGLLEVIAATLEYLKDNPIQISRNLTINLPIVMPLEYYNHPAILNYHLDLKLYTRIGGRLIGDSLVGPLFAAGFLLTVAPNQFENMLTGATWNDYIGDALVDASGFVLSESVGIAAGFATLGSNAGALAFKLGADISFGLLYDAAMDAGGRQQVIDAVGQIPSVIASSQVRPPHQNPNVITAPGPWDFINSTPTP